MVLVNDNWEIVRDLQDVSKIIRENYNSDLADELDKLIPEHTDEEYSDLYWNSNNKDYKISDLEEENRELKEKITSMELLINY